MVTIANFSLHRLHLILLIDIHISFAAYLIKDDLLPMTIKLSWSGIGAIQTGDGGGLNCWLQRRLCSHRSVSLIRFRARRGWPIACGNTHYNLFTVPSTIHILYQTMGIYVRCALVIFSLSCIGSILPPSLTFAVLMELNKLS